MDAQLEAPPQMTDSGAKLRVVIVAEHASAKFGGEAILPLHWFREMRARGNEAWLVVHGRTRAELTEYFAADRDRLHFVPDTWIHKTLYHVGRFLPHQVDLATCTALSHAYTQLKQRRIVRRLVREHGVDVVHQPIPVSPKEPSFLHSLGAPVVKGPLNGNMDWPQWYHRKSRLGAIALGVGRRIANLLNWLIPGNRRAAIILVANERTRKGLPAGIRGRVETMPENGVDFTVWRRPAEPAAPLPDAPPRFVFLGRLEEAKALPQFLSAFARARREQDMALEIIGDGAERQRLAAQVRELHLDDSVTFTGWVQQSEAAARLATAGALVLPSLRECGGAVVLEAMALGLPVLASDWGGPADYLDDTCGVLVPPQTAEQFERDMASALLRLARDPELRRRLGSAGRVRVLAEYDWRRKAEQMLAVYRRAVNENPVPGTVSKTTGG